MPIFESRDDFDKKMAAAGLTDNNCAYRAVNSIVSFAGGINIYDNHEVARELAKVGYEPLLIENVTGGDVDVTKRKSRFNEDVLKRKADIMCAACGMCVTIVGGYKDAQQVTLQSEDKECPVFSVVQ